METAYIIMIGIVFASAVGLVLLGRAADAAEDRYQQLLRRYAPDHPDLIEARSTRSKHLFE